ncbi:unnamed protein product [Onchocerca flexuosa]|uniref:Rav1p_C domain-containing protein n=1 Tax=Onchocerca flexuosa TaxID=387005 RepID=A0A183HNK4_9BILA|nr:unnamed protein product [Onchocerca flexuosa]
MTDGVQMLFLIGHGDDACRYLQAHGFWSKSFHFAKNLCSLLAANIGDWNRLSSLLMQNSKIAVARHLLKTVEARSIFVAYRPPAESTDEIEEVISETPD